MRRSSPWLLQVDERAGVAVVRVDRKVYPLDAVYGAAYELVDRAYVALAGAGKGALRVELRRKPGVETTLEALAGELANKLIDHALRVALARRHGRMRELIVARALAGAGAAEPEPAPPPPAVDASDPFALAEEWEESRKTGPGRRS